MFFIKCIFCGEGPVKIFAISSSNGVARSKCMNCGLNSNNESKKDKIKKPEVIYK